VQQLSQLVTVDAGYLDKFEVESKARDSAPHYCADPHDLVAVGDSHPTCRSRLKIFGTTNHGSRPSKSYQCTGKRNATADKPNENPLLHHGREVFSVPAS
jgi:hypothetical protein